MRMRLLRLLLLPILSLIFIIGWFMYFIGGIKEDKRKSQRVLQQTFFKSKNNETLEFGLVEELTEENKVSE
ncbi:MAG: hypothetical protein AC479_06405 [miscellaneous Crenarchaeota group-6 archaeon AD8-1]|nr:MAG: hypothetical protein AC479_06405 [miscellaneous Crenarchaeota group-6 archaeon AD8-1]